MIFKLKFFLYFPRTSKTSSFSGVLGFWGFGVLEIFLGYFWDILGIFLVYFGDILEIFWGYFGDILGIF